MATEKTWELVDKAWDSSVVPTISQYISIPNVSPIFDKDWSTNGLLEKAAELLNNWVLAQQVTGLKTEILKLPNKTPLIFITIHPTDPKYNNSTVLMYGHLDKQPPLTETWAQGLHPYVPVLKDGKLYGRGGADDGYAIFAAILSIKALQVQGIPHTRIVILIEASEESGSVHLEDYIQHLEKTISTPDLIICLDSGAGNYEQFWTTTTLRGLISGDLTVRVLLAGSHSGQTSGIVPSSFRILRILLDRIEDSETGEIKIKELHVEIPAKRLEEIKSSALDLGKSIYEEFALVPGGKPVHDDPTVLVLNRTWKPTLCITGVDGIPALSVAGNVLRTHTSVKLSIRLPPTADVTKASKALQETLLRDPPYGAQVTWNEDKAKGGFNAPPLAPWLETALHKASNYFCKLPANFIGEGGSIPFMGMLKEKFPEAQFVITGVLGPESNAHGPNEFLHIGLGKKVTGCVASILADHYVHVSGQK